MIKLRSIFQSAVQSKLALVPFALVMVRYRVRTGPGKPGKSWNFIMAFSRTGKSWKKATGPGKFWKSVNSAKNMKCMGSSKEN